MQIYDLKLLKRVSENISPAVARALEVGLISGVSYLLGAIMDGKLLSWNGLAVAVITPLWTALNKYLRDKQKQNESEN